MNATVSVNGKISDAATAAISVFDHGFLYGEGVYETMRTYHKVPFLYDRHARRLRQSAALLALTVPLSDAAILAEMRRTTEAHPGGLDEAYIRVLITRGVGELSYNLAACPTASVVVIVKPFPEPAARTFTEGIRLSLVSVRRNHPHALNPLIKSNNLINNALAMQEALRRGAEEALMQNHAGELVECSQSNFFLVRDGQVLTPPVSAGLLAGITREFVLELADELGISAREQHLTPADLATADEAFITGTTREITPVVAVDDRVIARGTPGELSTRLLRVYRQRAAALTRPLQAAASQTNS